MGRAILSKSWMSSDSLRITPTFMRRPSTDLGADRMMLEVNGLIMDIRSCPREAQQVAFEKRLADPPGIPADRADELTEE